MSEENERSPLMSITASPLRGRARRWGKLLTVTNAEGNAVVRAEFGKAAGSAYATFQTAGGRWRIEEGGRSGLFGAKPASVLDWAGNPVARVLEARSSWLATRVLLGNSAPFRPAAVSVTPSGPRDSG